MSFQGRRELVALGADPAKITVIYSGADRFSARRKNIGLIAYEQPNGRKRTHLMVDLAWMLDPSTKEMINFVIAGQGWEPVVEKMQLAGAHVQYFNHLPDENLQEFYTQMDALLVTGYAEGGPLPLLEAMACGLPVFSPPIGYGVDLLHDGIYETDAELVKLITEFVRPLLHRHVLARLFSWNGYVLDHALLFGRLLGETVDLMPRFGMARYAQLLDIISEIRPKQICEIGTWNGANAARMIQEAARYRPIERIEYTGFDLFEDMTGEHLRREGSKAAVHSNIISTRLLATGARIKLIRGDTVDTMPMNYIEADLYFIDGGHSEDTINSDWKNIGFAAYKNHAVVIFDDYYHSGKPDGIGCNELIDGLDTEWIVTHLPAHTVLDNGGIIGMVKVQHA
jgi:predicted O-methyltransferase YrrM